MLCVFPFFEGDAAKLHDLLEFIGQLGGCQEYNALLVADHGVQWGTAVDLLALANKAFRATNLISTDESVIGWPQGANSLWLKAASYAQEKDVSWLLLEPDAIPLKRGWLVSIDKMRGSGYFGHVYDCHQPGLPPQVLSGVAVYCSDALSLIGPCVAANPTRAWDVSSAEVILRRTTPTKLIHHFWGEVGLPPTFVETKTEGSPRNAFTLDHLPAEAVLFHRNKDGTLMSLLRRKLNLAAADNFVVVLPFCNLDVNLLIKNLDWMKRMGMEKTHDCLLSFDRTTNPEAVKQVVPRAREVFCTVQQTSYSVPHGTRFPQTAAWQHAARTMHRMDRNWLWMEADAIPLKKQWLPVLQTVYDNCRMPFAGPMVQGASHCNGTPAIYPANTPELLPRTMSHTDNAFDMEAAGEMRGRVKDIGHIAFCAWGIKDGKLNALEGEVPSFPPGSNHLLNQIPKTAVVFHRDKSGSIIDRLTT